MLVAVLGGGHTAALTLCKSIKVSAPSLSTFLRNALIKHFCKHKPPEGVGGGRLHPRIHSTNQRAPPRPWAELRQSCLTPQITLAARDTDLFAR